MTISDYRLLKNHLESRLEGHLYSHLDSPLESKIIAISAAQGPGTKPEQPRQPPEYPAPIEIPHPREIPSPVPGDAPTEFPGPDENPTPEIEPPKEQLIAGFSPRSQKVPDAAARTGGVTIRVQQTRARRTTVIRTIPPARFF